MNATEVISELFTENPEQKVVLETFDDLHGEILCEIAKIRYDRDKNQIILVAGNEVGTED